MSRKKYLTIFIVLSIMYFTVKVPMQIILISLPLCLFWLCKVVLYSKNNVINNREKDELPFEKQTNDICEKEDTYEKQGRDAEQKIKKTLERVFDCKNIIHDSYFSTKNKNTTQIDIVAIDKTGIYVIESKDYSGYIKGNEKNRNWYQIINNNNCYKFMNPIIQNKGHINAIRENLKEFNIPDEAYKSYIVFSNRCKLQLGEIKNAKVIQLNELLYTIINDIKITNNLLNYEQIEKVSSRLIAHTYVSEELKLHHKQRIKSKEVL